MGFLVIHTPRTGSKKPATIVGPGLARKRGLIKRMVDEATKQIAVVRASSDAQRQAEGLKTLPIRLDNAIGIAVPLTAETGRGYELYLLGGVDTAKIDAETTREVQNRLIAQTLGLAEPLISSQIPWAHRRDPANHAQFSGDLVIRDELGSYALMFSRLPEIEEAAKGSGRGGKAKPLILVFLLLGLGGVAILYLAPNYLPASLQFFKAKENGSDAPLPPTERTPAAEIATSTPTPTISPTRPPAPPKPVVMPDPFASADIDKLEKEMKKLRKLRTQIAKGPFSGKSLSEQMKLETEIIRFNRRRAQIVAAYDRIGVQAGQETLAVIPVESTLPDLQDPEKQQLYRTELDKIRADLQAKRKEIDPANMEQVESFYDETEWFNAKSQALSRALNGGAVPATPAATAPASTNPGAAPAITPLPLPPPP